MHPLLQAVLATLVVSLLSLAGIAFMALQSKLRKTVLFVMVAFAAGAMMSAALFHLIPETLAETGPVRGPAMVAVGFCFFFVLERFLHWHHCHKGECDVHAYTTLSLLGDGVHNFLDGLIIGGAFLISPMLGISTTVVIAAHELPQELGDYAVLVHGGYSPGKALLLNLLTALTAVAGAAIAVTTMGHHQEWVPYLMGFAAGNFIYIASSDLIPEIHREPSLGKAVIAFLFFVTALVLIAFMAAHNGHTHTH